MTFFGPQSLPPDWWINSSNFCPLLISIWFLFMSDNLFWGDEKIVFKFSCPPKQIIGCKQDTYLCYINIGMGRSLSYESWKNIAWNSRSMKILIQKDFNPHCAMVASRTTNQETKSYLFLYHRAIFHLCIFSEAKKECIVKWAISFWCCCTNIKPVWGFQGTTVRQFS